MRTASVRMLLPSLAMLLTACPASPGFVPLLPSGSPEFAARPFSQADLVGDWRYSAIFHGASVANGTSPGWERGTLHVASDGAVTVLSALDSAGNHPLFPPTPWSIDSDGFVTAGPSGYVAFHAKLNAARTLAAASGSKAGNTAALWILQKVSPGATFTNADVASGAWAYHELTTGATPSWEHGLASTDANGVLSLRDRVAQAGPQLDEPSLATLSVDANGMATIDNDPTWSGALSADRMLLVVTRTVSDVTHEFALDVLVRPGQTFAQADLAGRYATHSLVAGPSGAAGWMQGVFWIDAGGDTTWVSSTTNAGSTNLPSPATLVLAPDGTVTTPSNETLHATLAPSKDGMVRTSTVTTPVVYSGMAVSLK
jgi:hypothetical protein